MALLPTELAIDPVSEQAGMLMKSGLGASTT